MRIAVCLYGQSFRYLNTSYPNPEVHLIPVEPEYIVDGLSFLSLKSWKENIIDNNELDFFIHSWTTQDNHKSKLLEIFSPKSYIFEPYKNEENNKGQFISIHKSLTLLDDWEKNNKFQYDLVILTRLDLVWFRKIQFDKYLDKKKFTVFSWTNQHLIPVEKNNQHLKPYIGDKFGVMHNFFSGSSQDIKKLSNLIDSYDEYKQLENITDSHIIFRYHIEKNGLLENLSYQFELNEDLQIEYLLYIYQNPWSGEPGNKYYVQYLSSFLENRELWKNYFVNNYISPYNYLFYDYLYSLFNPDNQGINSITEKFNSNSIYKTRLSPYKKIKLNRSI